MRAEAETQRPAAFADVTNQSSNLALAWSATSVGKPAEYGKDRELKAHPLDAIHDFAYIAKGSRNL